MGLFPKRRVEKEIQQGADTKGLSEVTERKRKATSYDLHSCYVLLTVCFSLQNGMYLLFQNIDSFNLLLFHFICILMDVLNLTLAS